MWILTTQIAEEIRSASAHDVVVCDRSVLDIAKAGRLLDWRPAVGLAEGLSRTYQHIARGEAA